MPGSLTLSSRVLTVLQFTRAALVFTAIADTLAALFLRAAAQTPAGHSVFDFVNFPAAGAALAASSCLYGFGMSLNDVVDHRRDAITASQKPLPSGRLGLYNAHIIVTILALGSLFFGGLYALLISSATSFVMLVLTLLLINFYNFAGKYLVSAGILTLGLVRMTHVLVTAPEIPVVWHPLWLFTHVTILSAVAYVWEEKRPRITNVHRLLLSGGVVTVNVIVVAILIARRLATQTPSSPTSSETSFATIFDALTRVLSLHVALLLPVGATLAFFLISNSIARAVSSPPAAPLTTPSVLPDPAQGLRTRRRRAGQQLILAGLLWLIVLDTAFVLAFAGLWPALITALLLPVAYASVRILRMWAAMLRLAKTPDFRRATSL